jgi:hypothetical protein
VYDPARPIAGDCARPKAEDGNEVIMYSFDVVVDQQRQSLRQTMINLCDVTGDRLAQRARRVRYLPGDV